MLGMRMGQSGPCRQGSDPVFTALLFWVANIGGFRLFPSSCPLRPSHFRYTSKFEMTGDLHAYSEIAGDMHAQTRLETGWVCTR